MRPLTILGGASFRTFRCLWMLEELKLTYSHSPVWPGDKSVKVLNPLGKVPVLVDEDGFSMYESAAINTYLGDRYRSRNPLLVPQPGTHARGRYEQTVSVLMTEMDSQGLWIHRKHEGMGEIFTRIPEAVEHARKYFNKTNRALIQQLKDNGPYILGEDFTAADILYVHCLDWSKAIGWDVKWRDDQVVIDYLETCHSRPAYMKVHAIRKKERGTSSL